jgi:hypothetical protein
MIDTDKINDTEQCFLGKRKIAKLNGGDKRITESNVTFAWQMY